MGSEKTASDELVESCNILILLFFSGLSLCKLLAKGTA